MIPSLFFSPFSSLLSLSHSALSLFLSHFCLTPSFPLSLSLSPFPSLFVCFPSPPSIAYQSPPPIPPSAFSPFLPPFLPPSLPRPLPPTPSPPPPPSPSRSADFGEGGRTSGPRTSGLRAPQRFPPRTSLPRASLPHTSVRLLPRTSARLPSVGVGPRRRRGACVRHRHPRHVRAHLRAGWLLRGRTAHISMCSPPRTFTPSLECTPLRTQHAAPLRTPQRRAPPRTPSHHSPCPEQDERSP